MKKLDSYLSNWFADNADLDIDFIEGDKFEQDELNDIVVYSFTETTPYNDLFRNICIDIAPEVAQFDDFILSLFHEVGHIITSDDWSNKEWGNYMNFVNSFNGELTKKDYEEYYTQPIEWSTTAAGMELIEDNIEAVKEMQQFIKGL